MYNHDKKHIHDMPNLEHLKNATEDQFLQQAAITRLAAKYKAKTILKIALGIGTFIFFILLITRGAEEAFSIIFVFSIIALVGFLILKHPENEENDYSTGLDFSSMNLEELNNQINYYLNKGEPITLWGMSRENEKLILKSEKVLILQKLFEYLKGMGESLAEYKAGVFLHDEYIQNYINDYRMSRNRQAEINDQLHFNKMLELKNVERNMHLNYANQEIEILRKQAEVERIKAETDIMRIKAQSDAAYREAKTIGQIEVASLIREFVAQVDLTTINPSMNAYLMKVLFNPGNDDYVDMEMHEMMKEMIRKTKEAEIDKKNADAVYRENEAKIKSAEAKSLNYKAKGDKLTLDREKNKYKNN